jgi:peptide/nickel transport system substrate-binding protein
MIQRSRFGAVVITAMLLFAGCSSSTATPTATTTPALEPTAGPATAATLAPTPAAPTPKMGGTLVVGIPSDMVVADSALVQDSASMYIQDNVVEGLVALKLGTVSTVAPALASSWDVSADGKTYTFHLQTGVKFQDGTDFNAAAVKYNYDRWQNLPKPLQDTYDYYYGANFGGWGSASNITSVTASDAATVVMTLAQPQSNFLVSQAMVPFGIQSPTALKAGDADNPDPSKSSYAQFKGTGLVGTGPYKLSEWVPNDHVTVVKNSGYWDSKNAGYLDKIIFRPYSDQTAELNALQSGDLDVAMTMSPTDIAAVKSNSKLQLLQRGAACNEGDLGFNQTFPKMQDKNLRIAIATSLNRQSYVDAFYGGQGVVSTGWMPAGIQFFKAGSIPAYDLAKAKQLVGALPTSEQTLDLYYPSDFSRPYNPDPKAIFEAVARDLEAAGFKVNAHTEGWKAGYLTDMTSAKLPLFFHGWTCDVGTADNFLTAGLFGYRGTGNTPNPIYSYKNDALNQAMVDALRAATDQQATALWATAQDMISADLPSVPLVNSVAPGAAQAYVQGYMGAGNLTEPLRSVWLNK